MGILTPSIVAQIVAAAGVDLGDGNVDIVPTFTAVPGDAAPKNNDIQVTLDLFRIYVRTAGTWQLIGSTGGKVQIVGIGTWTDPGDSIVSGLLVVDTDTGIVWEWGGVSFSRFAPTLAQELADGIDGDRLATIEGLTEHQNVGTTLSTVGTARRYTLAAGGDYVASFTLISGTTIPSLLSASLDAMMEFVSGSSANYSFGALLMFDNAATDLSTGVFIGSAMTGTGTYFAIGSAEEPTDLYTWRDLSGSETMATDTISETGPIHIDAILTNLGRDTGAVRSFRPVYNASRWDNATQLDHASGGTTSLSLTLAEAYTRVRLIIAIHELGGVGDLVVDLHTLQGVASEYP